MIHGIESSPVLPVGHQAVYFGKKDKKKDVPPNEPITDVTEFYQGRLPNCQFLAAVYMMLQDDTGAMEKLFEKHEDGSYTVRFPGAPDKPVTVKADEIIADDWGPELRTQKIKGAEPVRILEAAYAHLLAKQYPDKFKRPIRLSQVLRHPLTFFKMPPVRELFWHPDFNPEFFTTPYAYRVLTGKKAHVYVKPDDEKGTRTTAMKTKLVTKGRLWEDIELPEKKFETGAFQGVVNGQLVAFADHPGRYRMAFVTTPVNTYANGADWGRMLPAYHVYVVEDVDMTNFRVTLKNPHNTRFGLVVPFEDMTKHFFKMYVVDKNH